MRKMHVNMTMIYYVIELILLKMFAYILRKYLYLITYSMNVHIRCSSHNIQRMIQRSKYLLL